MGVTNDQAFLGRRINVLGNSCSGKSTLAEHLARVLDVPFVELDALNWEPNWVALNETDPERFKDRIREATSGDDWVVAGSYSTFSREIYWSKLETIIWLDLPLPTLVRRVLVRSWRRWRSQELLWGTNIERFWPHLKFWNKRDSLLAWILSVHYSRRRRLMGTMADPHWYHIRFIRIRSVSELDQLLASLEIPPVKP